MVESQLTPTPNPLAPQGAEQAPQYSAAFRYADAFTAVKEGGRTANDGTGHAAAFGIDQKAHPEIDVMKLTPQEAQAMRYKYWQAINGDAIAQGSPKAAMIAYDTAIMAGPNKAIELVTRAQGDPQKMYQMRINYMNSLYQKDPQKYGPVMQNWAARNDDLGKVAGVIPGNANMPDLKQIAQNGVYIPAGYNGPMGAGSTQLASAGAESPKEVGVLEKIGQDFEKGAQDQAAAKKLEQTQQHAKPEIAKPTIALPQEIAPDKSQVYAKALEKITDRQKMDVPQAPPTNTPAVSTPLKAYMQSQKEAENEQPKT